MKETILDGLTFKQKRFVREYVATGNGTQSALKAYDIKGKNSEKTIESAKNVAKMIGSENLTKPNVIAAIKTLSEKIPDSLLIKKHKQLLNKQERVVLNDKETGSYIENTGQPHSDVVRALDMAYKLKGLYAPEKIQHGGGMILVHDYEKDGSTEPENS